MFSIRFDTSYRYSIDNFDLIFVPKHEEFSFLLKERVCQLVIKLFSPNTKLRTQSLNLQTNSIQTTDKPFWPITVRLLRIVSILIQKFYTMLVCVNTSIDFHF